MFTIIKQILESVKVADNNDWSWAARPSTWDYFRAEYKKDAQSAYEYWNATGRLNYPD